MNQSGFRDTVLRQSYVFNTGTYYSIQAATATLIVPSSRPPLIMALWRTEIIFASKRRFVYFGHLWCFSFTSPKLL